MSDYQGEEKCCGEYLRGLTSSNIEYKSIILVTLLIYTGFKWIFYLHLFCSLMMISFSPFCSSSPSFASSLAVF